MADVAETASGGRRGRRRRETVAEILDVAIEVMGEEGVGGLSLSEVARRMQLQPPSLYKYFPSKLAVYDALFAEGVRQHKDAIDDAVAAGEPGLDRFAAVLEASIRWCTEHPVLAQLMYWRPVPGFEPSPAAFAPAMALMEETRAAMAELVELGELHPAAASDTGLSLLTCLISGVISQQMANDPRATFPEGRFTRLVPDVFAMFVTYYAPKEAPA